jgi:hypothetical protein
LEARPFTARKVSPYGQSMSRVVSSRGHGISPVRRESDFVGGLTTYGGKR